MLLRLRFAPVSFLTFVVAMAMAGMAQGNVLPPAQAPRAQASPPSKLRVIHPKGYALGTRPVRAGSVTQLLSETFQNTATTANAWIHGDNACLTAGNATTPSTSVPACGANAPQYPNGSGAIEFTPPINNQDGFIFYATPLATASGLSATFNYYSYNSNGTAGDGLAFVLTDASKSIPSAIGGCCGSLGYAPYNNYAPLANGYLAVGLDETGYFSAANEGKTGGLNGLLPNIVTARGAAQANAQYLLSTMNASGQPAALPFSLDFPSSQSRPTAITVNVTLTAAGLLSISMDRHDGNGPLVYVSPTSIVGLNGQPAIPAHVYVGFTSAGGGANARHQMHSFVVTTAPASVVKASVLTYHNDNSRTGWNANETTLTTANVNASTFGLLHTVALDGRVDAQPLVVPGQPVDGLGSHDVVYLGTENDTVYAVDAQSGAVLKSRNLGVAIPNSQKDYDDNVYPTYGILSTPIIDRANNALYVVTDTNEGASAPDVYRLHKLALNNLTDLVASAVLTPTTMLSDGSNYVLPAQHERQRSALLETNGTIYVAFASTGDTQPTLSRGVIAGFSAANLAPLQSNIYTNRLKEVTNPFYFTSIWQSGFGPAADTQGNVYFATSNSNNTTPSYNASYNFPESVLKVSGDLSHILDTFTQYNYFSQDQGDGDFGAGGTMLLPDQAGVYPHLVVAGGKDGKAYILNRDALGGLTPNGPNKDLAELSNGGCWCGPAYFVGADAVARIVTGGGNGVTTWRIADTTKLAFTAEGRVSGSFTNGQPDSGGTIPAISSNGTASGSAILWFVQRPNDSTTYTMNLRAFDASNLSKQLFASAAGNWTNYNSNANAVPTIANGYVYVGSNKQLQIFGLLGH